MKLKIGTLLVASTLLDLTPSTVFMRNSGPRSPLNFSKRILRMRNLSGRPTLTIATPFTK
jgi:hypothetical protein